jgi:lysophospholipase L1-like esterase
MADLWFETRAIAGMVMRSAMKKLPLVLACTLLFQSAPANEKCVMLGDSLTFAYEAEFGFRIDLLFFGTFGDGFGPEVRNWVEILNDPLYRKSRFDVGTRSTFSLLGQTPQLFRHQYNWALPGLRIDELRSFMAGTTTFRQLVSADPDLATLLVLSNLNQDTAYLLSDLQSQIQTSASRLVLFIGGNDVRGVYGSIYNNNAPGSFVPDFLADATEILNRVQAINPNLPIVIVNVPHIGITPDIKTSYPTDPVKTGYVTAVLTDLNNGLAALARQRGLGYADVFTPTLSMLQPGPLAIHGIPFINGGSTTGNLDFVWLNGEYSANFHPNTNGQALIANEIIDAFNTRYGTGIAPLSATEILSGLHFKSAAQIDMPFATWMDAYGLTGLPQTDDSDGDGTPASVEFALGLNPTLRDSWKVRSKVTAASEFELAYPIRLPVSTRYSLAPAYSPDLTTPFTPFAILPQLESDGLARARLPVSGGAGFLRLQSTVSP